MTQGGVAFDPDWVPSFLRDPALRITVLTGAGVSTESGVPDFRSPGSPWLIHKPIGFADFVNDPALRLEAWRRKFAMDDIYAGAGPGRPHQALAHLARAGRLHAVVTQNIDGLHQAAGLPGDVLIELHGNGTFARCLQCASRVELADVRQTIAVSGAAPVCGCGGLIKSATVAFGQSLDPAVIKAATAAAVGCDVFLVVGSSLVVRPAATLPRVAQANGAALVIVNREPTPLDADADVVVHCDAGDFLQSLAGSAASPAIRRRDWIA